LTPGGYAATRYRAPTLLHYSPAATTSWTRTPAGHAPTGWTTHPVATTHTGWYHCDTLPPHLPATDYQACAHTHYHACYRTTPPLTGQGLPSPLTQFPQQHSPHTPTHLFLCTYTPRHPRPHWDPLNSTTLHTFPGTACTAHTHTATCPTTRLALPPTCYTLHWFPSAHMGGRDSFPPPHTGTALHTPAPPHCLSVTHSFPLPTAHPRMHCHHTAAATISLPPHSLPTLHTHFPLPLATHPSLPATDSTRPGQGRPGFELLALHLHTAGTARACLRLLPCPPHPPPLLTPQHTHCPTLRTAWTLYPHHTSPTTPLTAYTASATHTCLPHTLHPHSLTLLLPHHCPHSLPRTAFPTPFPPLHSLCYPSHTLRTYHTHILHCTATHLYLGLGHIPTQAVYPTRTHAHR